MARVAHSPPPPPPIFALRPYTAAAAAAARSAKQASMVHVLLVDFTIGYLELLMVHMLAIVPPDQCVLLFTFLILRALLSL